MIATHEQASTVQMQVETLAAGDLHRLESDASDRYEVRMALRWLCVLENGLQHEPYCIRVTSADRTLGILPLAFVKSPWFGRFLVSLPYVNRAGVVAASEEASHLLVDGAVRLADELKVRYLELRQASEISHSALTSASRSKVIMTLKLPTTSEMLWDSFRSKLRSQVKSGLKRDFKVQFGGAELLPAFYDVFSRNMRDLGTPVYSRRLFAAILEHFPDEAELCVVSAGDSPWAAALLMHHREGTEVPSASSLREHNSSSVNMVLYWRLLCRAIERGQRTFDFGRSSEASGTYRFKEQWGAKPTPSLWQHYVRQGTAADMRPENSRFSLVIRLWKRLPLAVTHLVGPSIVRGIP
jgi:serine/alanine adding enzyme